MSFVLLEHGLNYLLCVRLQVRFDRTTSLQVINTRTSPKVILLLKVPRGGLSSQQVQRSGKMSMVEEKELVAYAIECIKSVFPGLSSRPVPPLHKGVKVDLSRVIGALIEHVEFVLACVDFFFCYCTSLCCWKVGCHLLFTSL